MKFKFLCILILIAVTGIGASPQSDSGKITGMVADLQNKALPGATIVLTALKDTTEKKTRIADKNGAFAFSYLQNDAYMLTITNAGFQPYHNDHLMLDHIRHVVVLPV